MRLRPSEGWAQHEAWLRRPLASESEERIRCLCESRARKKSAMLAGAGLFALGLYGASAWDYGSSSFHVADEDWFGQHTDYGGADKAGHFITGYLLASAAAAAHRSWGLGRREAAWRGAASSMLWMTAIEVGDGFSEKYGFSYQDLIADAVGCLAAWLHETSPWVHRTIDFRWEYWPSESGLNGDEAITDDYDGSAYLMALNAGALLSRRPTAWDLLDLQVGYQTRGYLKESDTPERWVFVGLGLNLANLLRRLGFRYAALFDYYQVPFLSLRLGYELNEGTTDLLYAP